MATNKETGYVEEEIRSLVVGCRDCSISKVTSSLRKAKTFPLLHDKLGDIARELDIDGDKIKSIRSKLNIGTMSVSDALYDLLETWVGQEDKNATLSKVVAVLNSNGLKECAETLQREIQSTLAPSEKAAATPVTQNKLSLWELIVQENKYDITRTLSPLPDQLYWFRIARSLNDTFKVKTGRELTEEGIEYLRAKAFRSKNSADIVPLSLLSHQPLPGQNFTFSEWVTSIIKLIHEHLRPYWKDGLILGFMRRDQVDVMLKNNGQVGCFLLRFSGSGLGAVSICWVHIDGKVFHLAPFNNADLCIRSLADRIMDLTNLVLLYPDIPKQDVFGKYYKSLQSPKKHIGKGYVAPILKVTIPSLQAELSENQKCEDVKKINEDMPQQNESINPFEQASKQDVDNELISCQEQIVEKPIAMELEVIFRIAEKEYNEKMEGKVNDPQVFILPTEFADLHQQAVNAAIMHLELSVELRDKVSTHLDDIKEIYWKRNIMNLSSNGVPAIGIDLGTTCCCVAVFLNGKIILIPDEDNEGRKTFPSYVAFTRDGEEVVGRAAKDQLVKNTIYDVKRIIGRNISDPELQEDMKYWPFTVFDDAGTTKVLMDGKAFHPAQICAMLLGYCRSIAAKYLGVEKEDIRKAVISVPAYFNDGQRQATVDAGKVAGLEVLTINEPTAAAIAYCLDGRDKDRKKILVFDLGGGTFDVVVVDISHDRMEVLAVKGDCHLGGEDFNRNMMKYCAEQFKKLHGLDLFDGRDSQEMQVRDKAKRRLKRLQTKCEESKRDLTLSKSVTVSVDSIMNGVDIEVEVTRKTFEDLNQVYFQKAIDFVKETLGENGIPKGGIDDIVLVGGSSKIPKVQDMLSDLFDGKALNIYPDHAVAYGAAAQAALMNGDEKAQKALKVREIQDVTPMPIGVEKENKMLGVSVPKNSIIPGKWKKTFRTAYDDQASMEITILQGENLELAARNRKLGEFELKGIPPAFAGKEEVDVEIVIDEMGIMHVTATSKSDQGIMRMLTVEQVNMYNSLSDATINKLLEDRDNNYYF